MSEEVKTAEEQVQETLNELDQLMDPEVEMAKKHGLIEGEPKKEDDGNKEPEGTTEEVVEEGDPKEPDEGDPKKVEEEPEKEIKHSKDLDKDFEDMSESPEKEHEKLTEFSKSEKSFYWKWKNGKKQRQEAVAEKELLELKLKEMQDQIKDLKKRPSDIDQILASEEERTIAKQPVTREEYEADKQKKHEAAQYKEFIVKKINSQEAEARNKYEDFDAVIAHVEPIITKDPLYYDMYIKHVQDHKANAAEFAYKVGKLSYKPEQKEIVPVIDDKPKKQTSASLSSAPSSKQKKTTYEDMEITDVAKLSTTDWLKLPRKVRDRFLNM